MTQVTSSIYKMFWSEKKLNCKGVATFLEENKHFLQNIFYERNFFFCQKNFDSKTAKKIFRFDDFAKITER